MSTRHRIVTLVLLSSSTTALARPHHPHLQKPARSVLHQVEKQLAKFVDLKTVPRFQALTDADGYPYVGNVKTKGSGREDDEMDASPRLTTGFIARVFHVNGRGESLDL
jgi:hypothetical protein